MLGLVITTSSTRSHRVIAHDPHNRGLSSAGRIDQVPAGEVMVAVPSVISTALVVRVARCRVRHPRQPGQHQQAAVPAAEHALRPAVRRQAAQRSGHRIRHPQRRRLIGVDGAADRGPHRGGLTRPWMPGGSVVVVDRRDPAPLGCRRCRAVTKESDDRVGIGGQLPMGGRGAPIGEQRPIPRIRLQSPWRQLSRFDGHGSQTQAGNRVP